MNYLLLFVLLYTAKCAQICPEGFQVIAGNCWKKMLSDFMNQTEAEAECGRQFGATLLQVHDTVENEGIQRYITYQSVSQVWIGLTCTNSTKESCLWSFDRGDVSRFSNFSSNSPDPNVGNCMHYDISTRAWFSTPCDTKMAFICELPMTTDDPCEYNYRDHCYYPIKTSMKFGDAQDFCAKSCANVVSVHNGPENYYLNYVHNTSDDIMLGAVASSLENILWVDFSISVYSNLKNLNRGNCIFTGSDGKWFTDYCSREEEFICKRAIGSISSLQNEPTVVEVASSEFRPDFEQGQRQGNFGILHYTVNNRFKKIMLVGLANVLLIISFLLFTVFFILKVKCSTEHIIEAMELCSTTQTPVKSTTKSGSGGSPKICPSAFTLVGDKCYKKINDPLDRFGANATCHSYNSITSMIYTHDQNQLFIDFVGTDQDRYWLGLTCVNGDQSTCVADNILHAPFPYTAFADGSPNAASNCLYYNFKERLGLPWTTGDCSLQLPYVCEVTPSQTPVQENFECQNSYNGNCYHFHGPLPFTEAQDLCKRQCGAITSILDVEENMFINEISRNQSIYLGGLAASKNLIVWIDGSPVKYNNIIEYDEKSSCLVMGPSGDWRTTNCKMEYNFVCKVPFGAVCVANEY